MNANEVLSILDDDFSDANVEMAIAWLKTKKPTNKSAGRVLKTIFNHPKMEAELDWLTEWCRTAEWSFIGESLHDMRSVTLFEWIVSLLNSNPQHPDAGDLWGALLGDFRHEALEPGAKLWLENTKAKSEDANRVIVELIRLNPTDDLVKSAKQRLKENFDIFLLRGLIAHAGDEETYAAGKKVIVGKNEWWQQHLIAEAMVEGNLEANKGSVKLFLQNKEHPERTNQMLSELLESPDPNVLSFICDWMMENYDSPIARARLSRPFFVDLYEENALKLWNWFKAGEPSDVRFEILVRGYDNSWCPLPDDARVFVTEWVENHPKHRLIKFASRALTREAKTSFKTVDGGVIKKEYSARACSIKLWSNEFDEEAQNAVKEWMEKFPSQYDKLKTATHVFMVNLQPSDFASITYILDASKLSFKTFLLSELIEGDGEEFISMCLEVLTRKRLYKRWGFAHKHVGVLIAELLKVRPNSEMVLKHAEHWLKIRPDRLQFEMDLFQEITEAVKTASEKS